MEVITSDSKCTILFTRILKITLLVAALVMVPSFFLYNSDDFSFHFLSISSQKKADAALEKVLKNAAMSDKTVILTTVNEAWAANNSLLDIFLESFRIGDNTKRLLDHLVIVAYDQEAYDRCITLHPHCYALKNQKRDFSKEAFFMSHDYLEMMWGRIHFLHSILEMGYHFVFTGPDLLFGSNMGRIGSRNIMWFRDPFKHFHRDADFQIACDYYNGNSWDRNNSPNGGFSYVKSNDRAIKFYKYWYSSRLKFPKENDQDVLNRLKHDPIITETRLKMRFLSTAFYGGFCEPSRNLNLVCTMHANCCVGLGNKIHDLRIMLDDWIKYKSLANNTQSPSLSSWSVPQNCSLKPFFEKHGSP